MTITTDERSSHFVQSLERGLAVLRVFSAQQPSMTLSEVARDAEITRATARRFLLTLQDLGYVAHDGRFFSLTPRVLELGYGYLSSLSLPELAQPYLDRLSAEVQESASISVLDGDQIVYVARVPTKRIMSVSISVGTRFPAHATAMGRVLLGGLSTDELAEYLATARLEPLTSQTITDPDELRGAVASVRARGWCIVDQEMEEGLRSTAAPIHDRAGRVIAALNVSAHVSHASLTQVENVIVPRLRETARDIEADLRRSVGGARQMRLTNTCA